MHAPAEQQGSHSPKPVNSTTATSPIEHCPDSMQNSNAFPSQPKGKKRNGSDLTSESTKREHSLKHYDGDSGQWRSENLHKSEIAKLSEKGGLVDSDSVERLLQLMQPEKSHRKLDLSYRSMLAGIIAATERLDCLNLFVQRRGLPVLDDWLQEFHKRKVGSDIANDGDKLVEDFLLVLLGALDKLPVNLNALQMCNIGRSVNLLRSHKNLEIQKKARSLVDTWKQRVEAEMNINDAKSSSSQAVPCPTRSKHEISHVGKRHSSEAVAKTSGQPASAKSASVKLVQGETTGKPSSASSGIEKSSSSSTSMNANLKEEQLKMSIVGGCFEPQTTAREDKSSSSSQSNTNSQCSIDHARKSGKEDARRSTAGSRSMNKSSGASTYRKSANCLQGLTSCGAKKESGTSKRSSLSSSSASEKVSQSAITCANALATPVAESNSHKIIVKDQTRGCSPGKGATAGSMDELPCTNSRASSPAISDKCDESGASLSKKSNNYQTKVADALPEVDACGALPEGKPCGTANDAANLPQFQKDTSTRGKDSQLFDSSLNALIESREKYLEANTSAPVGDSTGMNLLASVAAGEMSRIDSVSLSVSPRRSIASADNPSTDYQGTTKSNDAEPRRLSSISSADLHPKVEPSSKTNGKLDEFVAQASMPIFPAGIVGKGTSDGSEQIHMMAASINGNNDSVTDARVVSAGSLAAEHMVKDETPLEKTGNSQLPCVSNDEQSKANHMLSGNVSIEYKPPLTNDSESKRTEENEGLVTSSSGADEGLVQNAVTLKVESTYEVDACGAVDFNLKQRDENHAFSNPRKEEESDFVFANTEKTDCKGDMLENKEACVHYSGASPTKVTLSSSGELDPKLSSKSSDVIASEEEQKDKEPAVADAASISAGGVPDMDRKLGFDLNEGFNMDNMKNGGPVDFAAASLPISVSLISPCSSLSPASGSLPASVTVTAAAKEPFLPPEDLLRNKTELGWKGSAATSAFRPAEPRKVLEISTGSSKVSPQDAMACKQVRPLLEIDLNLTDERIMQDICSQNASPKINHKPDHRNNSNCELMGSAPLRYSGGFELDLNRVVEASELVQQLAGNSLRLEVSSLPVQSSSSSEAVIVEAGTKRDFDLNNGPAVEETTFEPLVNQQALSNIPQHHFGLRMNNARVSDLTSWYSPGTAYSAVTIPTPLPDRGNQPFSIMEAGGSQRISSGPTSGTSLNPDFCRGSILSSSPAVAFATTPFQYPVFSFGTSFSLATSSLPGGSAAYTDPSSAARFHAPPAIPSQFVGKAASVSSPYLHPCVVMPDIGSNVFGESSQKRVRQGLDLNCGPGSLDVEGRDEVLPRSSRQFSSVSSQGLPDERARTYEVSGDPVKRKEPDGGWETDRNSY